MNRVRILFCTCILAALVAGGCAGTREAAPARGANDPSVLAVYGDEVLTVDEFEARYARSVGSLEAARQDSAAAYREFLDRYLNFRLKVLAAQAAGLGESEQIAQEIDAYRTNLARPYLMEQQVLEPIMRELYQRRQDVVDASHLLVLVDPNAAPEDTLAAYRRMQALVDSVRQGLPFGEIAARHSEDPSARREGGPGYQGRLGFFGAGTMVPEFEEMAYTTPVGDLSPIFRTRFGYHVLSVHDRKPAVPDREFAHIMITPAGRAPEDSAAAWGQIEALIQRLAAGEDFATLARQHSQDQFTASRGGTAGYLNYYAPMPQAPNFKEAIFSIENEGDVSGVIVTPFGLHLIKLIDIRDVPTYEAAYSDLKAAAARTPQARAAERRLADEIRQRHGGTFDAERLYGAFAGIPADSLAAALLTPGTAVGADAPFATLGDSTYTVDQLVAFAEVNGVERKADARPMLDALAERFLTEKAIDYEAAALETRDPEFGRIMGEFRDGLMLFKLMEDSVWTAASKDSVGLQRYFAANAGTYRFSDRTRIIGFYANTDSLAQAVVDRLDAGASAAAIRATFGPDSLSGLRIDTTYVSGGTNSIFDQALSLETGAHTGVFKHRREAVVLLRDGEEAARAKTFEEARAEVVSDYQEVLEQRLLARLRARYNVRLYPDRLDQAFSGDSTAGASTAAVRSPVR